jgi:hypothetical protein
MVKRAFERIGKKPLFESLWQSDDKSRCCIVQALCLNMGVDMDKEVDKLEEQAGFPEVENMRTLLNRASEELMLYPSYVAGLIDGWERDIDNSHVSDPGDKALAALGMQYNSMHYEDGFNDGRAAATLMEEFV